MKVLFSYGKKVEPALDRLNAFKEVASEFGIETVYVEYDFEQAPDDRAAKLLSAVKAERHPEELVLVGSSMGAYGSLLASMSVPVKALFLISPALFMYNVKEYSLKGAEKVEFVIGWKDAVIPLDKVLDYVRAENAEAHLVDNDHLMFDSLPTLKILYREFLRQLLG